MTYPPSLEEKLGFTHLRELVRSHCASVTGQRFAEKMAFTENVSVVERLLQQTQEMKVVLQTEPAFPQNHYYHLLPTLKKAEPENAWLDVADLHQLRLSLETLRLALAFFKNKEADQYPQLRALMVGLEPEAALEQAINRVIDDKPAIKDSASTELQRIRHALVNEHKNLRRKLEAVMRKAREAGMLADNLEVSVRNGRMVIPVLAEYKRKLSGFIHDESATGQTVFIEPAEVIETNNHIRELELEERREIVRILTQLTNAVRPSIGNLRRLNTFLGLLDFIRAKARLANELNALMPLLQKQPVVQWRQARHPILYLKFRREERQLVPLDITLNADQRILIISGPNAGGKSIVLKTVGLLQYMLQCGLLVPVAEGSTFGIFDEIFTDIGDEQSLENDLSTYSSHLKNMSYFLRLGGKKTLMLIDEFGTGTEPQFGGAIAEAVLGQMNKARMFGVITTHYGNLKDFANANPGVVNGSMAFDRKQLLPLFRLEIGRPGSSYALEIAQRMGLPKNVIAHAKTLLGKDVVAYDQLIGELESQRSELTQLLAANNSKEQQLDRLRKDYTELKELLDSQRKNMLNEAKNQARELVRQANRQIEATIRDIKEAGAEKEATREARRKLEEFREELAPTPVAPPKVPTPAPVPATPTGTEPGRKPPRREVAHAPKPTPVPEGPLQVGDFVKLIDGDAAGELLAISERSATIRIGQLKTNVKPNRLQRISRQEYIAQAAEEIGSVAPSKGVNLTDRMANFSATLDLRGYRGEEALPRVASFIDDALLLGIQELRILHGKGDGILRQLVRNQLQQNPRVARMADEHADRGGAGITVVTLD